MWRLGKNLPSRLLQFPPVACWPIPLQPSRCGRLPGPFGPDWADHWHMPWQIRRSPVEVGSQFRVGSLSVYPHDLQGFWTINRMHVPRKTLRSLEKIVANFEDFRISPKGGNPQLPTSSNRAREAGPISPSGLAWASQEIEGIGTQNVGVHLVILRLQYSKCWTRITLRGIKFDFGFNLTPNFGELLRRPVLHSLLHYIHGTSTFAA